VAREKQQQALEVLAAENRNLTALVTKQAAAPPPHSAQQAARYQQRGVAVGSESLQLRALNELADSVLQMEP
jgi:hypothetical protein